MRSRLRTISDFTLVGKTGASHGSDGELKVHCEDDLLEEVLSAEFLFIELKGDKVPFRVEWFRQARDLLVKFDGIGDSTLSAPLIGRPVYLPSDEITVIPEPVKPQGYDGLAGYEIHDLARGPVGRIDSVEHYPEQVLALLHLHGNEVLVPLNDTFVDSIDHSKKTVYMNLPAGLPGL